MAYVVDDKCINCKHSTCVTVCPVDCFYEGVNMIVINPGECIDCGVCVPECPEEAIYQTDDPNDKWYKHNEYFSEIWPNITEEKDPMPDYEQWTMYDGDKTEFFKKDAAE
jgi:ferredoxin